MFRSKPSSCHSAAPLRKLCGSGGSKLTRLFPHVTSPGLRSRGSHGPAATTPSFRGLAGLPTALQCPLGLQSKQLARYHRQPPQALPTVIGACANQTWRRVTTRVDKRRPSSLDMSPKAWRAASFVSPSAAPAAASGTVPTGGQRGNCQYVPYEPQCRRHGTRSCPSPDTGRLDSGPSP
ncbi:hypothetical protein CHARACLAT_028530 [Characodon lateralis]|uniref:Uncharacterized protein n=1 Tax=Characodon lateralis TaxID=208331 RepID=A0ABU7CVE2_9TELE|nr:hypothetical protein [Characodon lateralis]